MDIFPAFVTMFSNSSAADLLCVGKGLDESAGDELPFLKPASFALVTKTFIT